MYYYYLNIVSESKNCLKYFTLTACQRSALSEFIFAALFFSSLVLAWQHSLHLGSHLSNNYEISHIIVSDHMTPISEESPPHTTDSASLNYSESICNIFLQLNDLQLPRQHLINEPDPFLLTSTVSPQFLHYFRHWFAHKWVASQTPIG